jgi:S-adenosylmethionine:tRNA ribosyltransferase-isomerase
MMDLGDTSAYDYELPPELVARTPAERRDAARLLVLEPGGPADRTFADFPALLRAGDVLVLNETRVIPARLRITRAGGGSGEVLLLRPADRDAFAFEAREWFALVRPGRRLRPGARIDAGGAGATILEAADDGVRRLRFDDGVDVGALLERSGEVPLPPYVGPGDAGRAARYQTVFARVPGSVAAPTASLHFTPEILAAIAAAGVEIVRLTLDVGIGTFRPMHEGPVAAHRMHAERFAIPEATAAAVMGAKRDGRRVVAAGTTVVRALEGAAQADGIVRPGAAETRLFIRAGFEFRIVDALLTNFHLPRSTLLVLVAAFAGYEPIRGAYRTAIERRYRFFSFGDAMFAERARGQANRARMPDTPILEISRLEEIFEDDTTGIADLLEAAMKTGMTHLQVLHDAIGRSAIDDVMRASHAIKGSTANIGGNEVAAVAGRIETAARAGTWTGIAEDATELDQAYERLQDAVRTYRAEIS